MKWLNGSDAVTLYSEMPNAHMHLLAVGVMELDEDCQNFDIEAFRRVIRGRLYKLEPLCYQLVNIPFKFHHPMWREHCDVDLTYHIRPWRLPAPGGRRELDEVIGEIASTPLDRSRPLWEMYFVEGLADNRIAVVTKIHHALVDGVSLNNLVAHGMDLQPGPEGGPWMPDPVPTKRQLMRLAFADHLRQAGQIPQTISYTAQGVARVRRSSRTLATVLRRSFVPPPTFMNHVATSPERRFASTTLVLADVKQTGKHLGVTINDLVLAMSTGALRTLLLRYDGKADPLLATVPVALDLFPDRISGNFVDTMSVALPVDLEDPLERIRRCRENAISAKEIQQLRGPELVHRWLTYTTPVALEVFFRLAFRRKAVSKMPHLMVSNVAISNVPGLAEHGRVGGALLTDFYMVGPLAAWSGLLITVSSYVDQLNISVLTDDGTVKDPHEVTEAMNAEFIEIRRSPAFLNS